MLSYWQETATTVNTSGFGMLQAMDEMPLATLDNPDGRKEFFQVRSLDQQHHRGPARGDLLALYPAALRHRGTLPRYGAECGCRSRKSQADISNTPGTPIAVRKSLGRNAAHCPGRPLQLTVLRIPLRGTRLQHAVDLGCLCRPSGPDGEDQARGQARNARGKPRRQSRGRERTQDPYYQRRCPTRHQTEDQAMRISWRAREYE